MLLLFIISDKRRDFQLNNRITFKMTFWANTNTTCFPPPQHWGSPYQSWDSCFGQHVVDSPQPPALGQTGPVQPRYDTETHRRNLSEEHINYPSPCFLTFPDRFLDDQGQRVTPSCFLPFGAGPRVCVGESLARLELFLFLSSLLQQMSFRLPDGAPPPDLQGRLGVVLQPLPYEVVVTRREGWESSGK